jgi:RNAse (barnase) inhibitor barstar
MWEYHAAIVGGRRMKELLMDGRDWKERDDVYNSFFHAVGAPSWPSRNFNALRDSIATGKINRMEAPYCLVIQNYDLIIRRRSQDDG